MNYIADQICTKIGEKIQRQHKNIVVKNHQIKANLWLFVNSYINNPSFDSQTKDSLTTKPENFGSECTLPESVLKNYLNSGIIDTIVKIAEAKDKAKLKRMAGGKKQ